jgi:hypothetical protein
MSEDNPLTDSPRYAELERRRPVASPHLKTAINALDEAIEAFGGWWPPDRELSMVVARLMCAVDIIEAETKEATSRRWRQANERLIAVLERSSDEQHVDEIAEIRFPADEEGSRHD